VTDQVNKAAHYNQGGIECIKAIEASMSPAEFMGALKFNVLKYVWRYRDKGKGSQDLAKAEYYLKLLRERQEMQERSAALLETLKTPGTQQPISLPPLYIGTPGIGPAYAVGGPIRSEGVDKYILGGGCGHATARALSAVSDRLTRIADPAPETWTRDEEAK
jgi:Protein of unknwon function (DUF3310)